ncbi:MAG: glycosyltransferase family 4 protein [Mogibacterium sp.]|nr:glycosyltransferase family 4 protein [Mogibacterium sp.]
MKILSITAQKPHSTGSGTYMTEIVRAFARTGHKQAVVCGIFPDDIVDFPEGVSCYPVFFTDSKADLLAAPCKAAQARFSALPFPVVGMSDIMPYTSTRYRDLTPGMISQFEEAFTSAVNRAVDELDPDLIICHHLFLLTALVRKHFPDRRIVGISHGTDLRQMINCDSLRDIVRPYIKELDAALALHDEQRTQIIEIFGMDESRVSVIGSGYNSKLFNTDSRTDRSPGDPLRIAYAGKISRPKGVPEMLAALERLASDSSTPAFKLTMAGGCQDEVMKKKLEDLPVWAEWLGQIPQPALAELLRQTDIFILPSYFEGLPLVLIEAMSSGAVPVSTDLPGIRGWIDSNVSGSNAVFVPMPQMKSIDEPTEAGRKSFTDNLAITLYDLLSAFDKGDLPGPLPDTSTITWDGLSSRLLSICQ